MSAVNHKNGKKTSPVSDAGRGLSRAVINILTVPVRLIEFATKPPGSAILIGFGVLYFACVSAEGYWQSMPPSGKPAFMPKPFVEDGANIALLWGVLQSPSFWMAALVSLIVQGIQAFVLREIEVAKAIADYKAVEHYQVPEAKENQIDLAKYRRAKIQSAGMRTVRTRGALIALTYAIDFAQALWNYPLLGLTAVRVFINFVWVVASVFGTEAMINLFWGAISPIRQAKVEIID